MLVLAWTDPDPRLFYTPTWVLIGVFSFAGLMVSPLAPACALKQRVSIGMPVVCGFLWFLALMCPMHNDSASKMVCGICAAFGAAFSLDLWRHSDWPYREPARVAFFLFLLAIPLSIWFCRELGSS